MGDLDDSDISILFGVLTAIMHIGHSVFTTTYETAASAVAEVVFACSAGYFFATHHYDEEVLTKPKAKTIPPGIVIMIAVVASHSLTVPAQAFQIPLLAAFGYVATQAVSYGTVRAAGRELAGRSEFDAALESAAVIVYLCVITYLGRRASVDPWRFEALVYIMVFLLLLVTVILLREFRDASLLGKLFQFLLLLETMSFLGLLVVQAMIWI